MSLATVRIEKLFQCLTVPRFFVPFLRWGVAPTIEHRKALARIQFDTLIDIGANRGQFSLLARELRPSAKITAFEPLEECASVAAAIFRGDEHFQIFSVAIAEVSGVARMHIAGENDSSSLKSIGALQSEIFGTRNVGTRNVQVSRLAEFLDPGSRFGTLLIKIDVQGGELDCLKGCADILPLARWVYVECSYLALYDEQPLISDVIAYLYDFGFELSGVFNQSVSDKYGPVQADVLFSAR